MFSIKDTINSTRATLRAWSSEDSGTNDRRASGGLEKQLSLKKKQKEEHSNGGGSNAAAIEEYKRVYDDVERLRRVVLALKGEYEDSKQYEMFRRYRHLKGMIKRTVMYVRLGTAPDEVSGGLGLGQLVLLSSKATSRSRTGASTPAKGASGGGAEVPRGALLPERLKELRQQAANLRSSIETMERAYEASKQYMSAQRYGLLKAMIKRTIRDSE